MRFQIEFKDEDGRIAVETFTAPDLDGAICQWEGMMEDCGCCWKYRKASVMKAEKYGYTASKVPGFLLGAFRG